MTRSSRFGHIERLASGKWRARCTGPDGIRRSKAFLTKTDARIWLSTIETAIAQETWRPPASQMTVGEYVATYVARHDLRPSTRKLYEDAWRLHLESEWSSVVVSKVTPDRVRVWHAGATKTVKPTALSIAYRLLRAVFNVAITDGAITANPCRVRGAGSPKPATPARALTVAEVQAIAAEVPARYEALVLVLGFGGLRFGEATALCRKDIEPDGGLIRVERNVRFISGDWIVGPPKTDAGRRTVAMPALVADALVQHMGEFAGAEPDSLVFCSASGRYLYNGNFGDTFGRAVARCGFEPVRVHWLRHTSATLAASTGASTKELMHRLGHSSPDAALGYQHAVSSRDSEIASALDALIKDGSHR